MQEIKEALAGYACIHSRLPFADTDGDGAGDTNQTTGTLPYLDLGLGARVAWRSAYTYDVNDRLVVTTDPASLCTALAAIAAGEFPQLAFAPAGAGTSQALVVISGAENSTLDGENGDGDRAYESFSPTDTFNDLVVAFNPNTLYGKLDCGGGGNGGPGTSCTSFTVRHRAGGQIWIKGGSYLACTRFNNNTTFTVNNGDTIYIFTSQFDCLSQPISPQAVTFADAAGADADGDCAVRWNGTGLIDE
jgi:YD repeat-containing protein